MSLKDYIERLHEERGRAWNEGKQLVEKAAAEKRELSAEEQTKFDKVNATLDEYDGKIKAFVETEAREREADEARSEYDKIVRPAQVERKDRSEEEELRTFFRGEGPRYIDFDLTQVAREKALLRSGIRGNEFRVLQEDVAAAGGAGVPTTFVRQLYDFLEVYSGVRKLNVTVLTTASGEPMTLPKVTSHGTAALVGEGTALAANDPKFGTAHLDAWKYGQLVQLSNELITDAGFDVIGYVAKDCARAIARATDTAYVSGSGSGQPQGFGPIVGTGATAQTGSTGLPSFNNIIDLIYSVNQEYRAAGAQFLMKDATAGALRKITDSQNRPLWEASYQVGTPDTIMSYPVFTDPNVNALSTAATQRSIFFGDWSAFYIRDVGSVRLERSDDFAFDKDLVTWRCIFRTDSDLIDLTGALKTMLMPTT